MTLSALAAAAEAPGRVALVAGGAAITWERLAERVRERMAWLDERGAGAGPVAVVAGGELDTVVTLHALIARGTPAALLHPRLTPTERAALVAHCRPALVVDAPPPPASIRAAVPAPGVPDDDRPLAIVATSGTTGRPRGAVLSRAAFVAAARASAARLGWQGDDRWLLAMPLAHVGGLSILTRCLLARAAVVLGPPRFDPAAVVRAVEDDGVTLVSLVPTMLARLLDAAPGWRPPARLRAAAPLLERAAARGLPVLCTYGLTEACSQVATQPPGAPAGGDCGPPLPGVEVRIVDGRIQLRGPALLSGYLGEAEPPFLLGGWFDTGDLGALDERGHLRVLGRRTELIVTGGENVHPREVEAVLEGCPGVAAACVFGVPDETWGEVVAAAVVPHVPTRALAAHLRLRLAPHKLPRRIGFLPDLPLTAAGKPDRVEAARRAALRPLEI